ncbi:MAG: threonylcarbamoyl-AMP synthase [bacterium]|nr:MAG: threonylcarbamoyl-AMP synthase [bacterium]
MEGSGPVPAGTDSLRTAVALLRNGGLVIVPTETFYGIACDALDPGAVGRLALLKARERGKPIPLIAGSVGAIREAVSELPPLFQSLAGAFWPGPLTLVLAARSIFPGEITAGTSTIGVRIPGESFALELARAFGGLITATSANVAGQPPPRSPGEIDLETARGVDLVVDGGVTPGGLPSTVLDLTLAPPAIVRPGPLDEQVAKFLLSGLR